MNWLSEVLGRMDWFSLTLGFSGLAATILVAIVSTRQLNRVSRALDEKINNIEELTRKPVTDFPSILRYAETMVDDLLVALQQPSHGSRYGDDCLWVLNYTPVLGRVHSYNTQYSLHPRFKEDPLVQAMAQRALTFAAKLEALSKVSSCFRLVTVSPKEIEQRFLRPILTRFQVTKGVDAIVADIRMHHSRAIQNIIGNLEASSRLGNIRFVSEVRTQMLIAKINGQGRCLVFSTMGGLAGNQAREHYVRGFYTQLDHIVEFYRDRFEEVFDNAAEAGSLGYLTEPSVFRIGDGGQPTPAADG